LSDPLRRAAWEQRWRDCGASEEEVEQRRARVGDIVALDTRRYAGWLEQAGFEHQERVFSSLFFEVWACLRNEK